MGKRGAACDDEEDQGNRVLWRGDLEGVKRFDEEVGRAEGANNGGEEPGPETAQTRGYQDGREEASSQKSVRPNRPVARGRGGAASPIGRSLVS